MWKRIQDPVSGLTHLAGALLGVGGMVYLISRSIHLHRPIVDTIAFGVFGLSLVLLYLSSAFYHMLDIKPESKLVFRQLDHAMIFVLIAGSYTPYCLVGLKGTLGWVMFAFVWAVTVGGLVVSIWWIHAPRWLSTALYLGMGWTAVGIVMPLHRALGPQGFFWLVAGGLSYTFGAVIYAVKRPDPFPPYFGFHEIWHLFVLGGSVGHVISISSLLS